MICTQGGGLGGGALVGFEIGQKGLIATAPYCHMATFVYRCPTTGLNVQGWFADDPSEHEGEVYETITEGPMLRWPPRRAPHEAWGSGFPYRARAAGWKRARCRRGRLNY
jgi:hypothetical protein